MAISSKEFPLNKSPNPKASQHFLNAMEYKIYIARLHNYVNYDNFLITRLLNKMNEEYEKGKSLLPKDSAEDVYWYVVLYRDIYGIGGYPEDKDMSISYKKRLSDEGYKKYYEEILLKIKRFENDDFDFDVPRITQYKYEFMTNLIDEFMTIEAKLFKKNIKSVLNRDHLKALNNLYLIYIKYKDKYLPLANKQDINTIDGKRSEIRLLNNSLALELRLTHDGKCNDRRFLSMISNIKDLKILVDKTKHGRGYFLYDIVTVKILNIFKRNCPSIKEEAEKLLSYFEPKLIEQVQVRRNR